MNKEIIKLIEEGRYIEARNEIVNIKEINIAHFFEEIEQHHLLIVFRMLPKDMASGVFKNMSSDLQRYIVESIRETIACASQENFRYTGR